MANLSIMAHWYYDTPNADKSLLTIKSAGAANPAESDINACRHQPVTLNLIRISKKFRIEHSSNDVRRNRRTQGTDRPQMPANWAVGLSGMSFGVLLFRRF